ncbi:GDSL esterase/lipase At1g33811-like [Amaranthus tricolor]|uniref:GDSL esterase/lipase At1g33811-like n=1 Tax=Amaranthus tricolor TaxID=29722 RepID=UPI0025826A98|nr:GDSL esterase/lipase At1g33811-like [Amaranthus tricolor]
MSILRATHMKGFSTIFITILLLLLLLSFSFSIKEEASNVQEVPCFFIFGDSLVDNGNNNLLDTFVKSNYLPYGIDFPFGPTGRFNNGRTVVDVLAELLGFTNFIPPFSIASFNDSIKGVNFASGAAGIRDDSGRFLGVNIPMNGQINNFAIVVDRMREYFGGNWKNFQNHISKCIVYSGMGNNDYLNNLLVPQWLNSSSSTQFSPQQYTDILIQQYSRQLKVLYRLGIRKVIVTAIGQIGCIPIMKYMNGSHYYCNENLNYYAKIFNSALRGLVDKFNYGHLPGAKFVYLDLFQGGVELIENKSLYGLEVVDKGCCGEGTYLWKLTCFPWQTPCADRQKYFYWDGYHPTEVVHAIIANKAYTSNLYSYPINIKDLAML